MIRFPEDLGVEWDPRKNASNVEKHGVTFLLAARIFLGRLLTWHDDRHAYGEDRFIAVGQIDAVFLTVVFTMRGTATLRLISAWKAGKHERTLYRQALLERPQE